MKEKKTEKGFTLIELLVVIAIITILAAILFPVFAKVREKGRQTACLSNLKQLGLGVQMYNQDYDGQYPWVAGDCGGELGIQFVCASGTELLKTNINSYLKNDQIWRCPSAENSAVTLKDGSTTFQDYSINALLTGGRYTSGTYPYPTAIVGDTQVVEPSKTLLMFERNKTRSSIGSDSTDLAQADSGSWGCSGVSCGYSKVVSSRQHNDGANLAFCDGHAKWQKNQPTNAAGNSGVPGGYTFTPY